VKGSWCIHTFSLYVNNGYDTIMPSIFFLSNTELSLQLMLCQRAPSHRKVDVLMIEDTLTASRFLLSVLSSLNLALRLAVSMLVVSQLLDFELVLM
jgi:hypothetical protein